MKKLFLLTVIALFSLFSVANAEISKEKRAEIDKMLRLTGMEKLMVQMKGQMIAGLKEQMKDVPETFWSKFEQKMDMSELMEKLIPLYDKYYTVEDLKTVNAFYQSETGKKLLSTLPQIMQESMKIGQEWGTKIGEQAAKEAVAESKKNQ